jgi:hypothetical protein
VIAVAASLVAASLVVLATGRVEAVPPAANPADKSSAIRYRADGTMIGSVIRSLVAQDDDNTVYPGLFPLNFFGTKYANICMTENGGVFPTNDAAIAATVQLATETIDRTGCGGESFYDVSVAYSAVEAEDPFIAVLATDHNLSEDVAITPSWEINDLKISSIVGDGTTVTVTMAKAHGYTVGSSVTISNVTGTGGYNGTYSVDSVPSATTFTYTSATTGAASGGSTVRPRTYGALATITGDGTNVTVVTAANHNLGTGDYITFAGTGIAAVDDKHFEVTKVNNTTLTFAQPAGFAADRAGLSAGQVTALTAQYKWFVSDGYGAIGQMYYGTTTVSGRDAMVITWYRVAMYSSANPKSRFSTVQLLLVKKATGDDTVGWDFDVEYNYGTMTDDEDGYRVVSATVSEGSGASGWTADDTLANGGYANAEARWGIGWASYKTIIDAQNYTITNCPTQCTITLTTAAAHGLKPGDLVRFTDVNGAPFQGRDGRTQTGTTGTTIVVKVPGYYTSYTNTAVTDLVGGGATELRVSEDYEIFPNTGIGDLVEQSARSATRLTSNHMNAPTVLGRYTFGMVGGVTTGFERPAMGAPPGCRGLECIDADDPVRSILFATTTVPPVPFLLPSGDTPRVRPGEAVMYVGGEAIDLTIRPAQDRVTGRSVLRMSSAGQGSTGAGAFELTIGGDCPTCAVTQESNGNNVLGLEQSAGVRVGGYGFGPQSQINVFVSSTTRLIGFFKADGDGAFLGTVKVPTDLPRGNHTIQVSGFTADNTIRSVSLGVTVEKATPAGCRVVKRKGKKPVTVCPKKPAAKKAPAKKK